MEGVEPRQSVNPLRSMVGRGGGVGRVGAMRVLAAWRWATRPVPADSALARTVAYY